MISNEQFDAWPCSVRADEHDRTVLGESPAQCGDERTGVRCVLDHIHADHEIGFDLRRQVRLSANPRGEPGSRRMTNARQRGITPFQIRIRPVVAQCEQQRAVPAADLENPTGAAHGPCDPRGVRRLAHSLAVTTRCVRVECVSGGEIGG